MVMKPFSSRFIYFTTVRSMKKFAGCLELSTSQGSLQDMKDMNGYEARQISKEQTKTPRFTLEGPRPCTILCMNYVIETFLVVSCLNTRKHLLYFVRFVQGQGQKSEQKHVTKTFVGLHNHSFY